MPQRQFPRPRRFETIPGGYRAVDANRLAAHGDKPVQSTVSALLREPVGNPAVPAIKS